MDLPHRVRGIRHLDSPSGTVLEHGSSTVADESLLGQYSPYSDGTVPEPLPTSSSTVEERFEQTTLHAGSHGLFDLLGSQRATSSPDYSAYDSDQEESGTPDRKKVRLSPEAADVEAAAPVVTIIPHSILEEDQPIGVTWRISSGNEPPQQNNARRTSYTASAGDHRDLEPPGVTPLEFALSQPSPEQYGGFHQHLFSYSTSPGPSHAESHHETKETGTMQASSSTGCGSSDLSAFDASTGNFHATLKQNPLLAGGSVSELSQVTVNTIAPSQSVASRTTNTTIASGGPRMVPYWGYLHNQQGTGPTFPRPERSMAVAAAASTAHQMAPLLGTELVDVAQLGGLIELQQHATSQTVGAHLPTTFMDSGGPSMAAYWGHLDNDQGAGVTFPNLERQMVVFGGPPAAHESALQHGPQQPQVDMLELERLTELQHNESDDDDSSPFISSEVALVDPHLHSPPSSHPWTLTGNEQNESDDDDPSPFISIEVEVALVDAHLQSSSSSHPSTQTGHHSPMPGPSFPRSPPTSPHPIPPPGFLLHMQLGPSFNDMMAANPPEMENFEPEDDDDFDDLMDLDEMLEDPSSSGMSQDEIERLMSYPVTAESEAALCTVCISHYQAGEYVRVLPCGHVFHSYCIDHWLRINRTCPLCRRDASK